jgi:hypothetical protein
VIGGHLERSRDPRANRFGPDTRERDRPGRTGRPLRGAYYDPFRYYRDFLYGDSTEDALPNDTGYLLPERARRPSTLGRAYDLQGPPSYTPIRSHDAGLVRGGFRLYPVPLPTLVVYATYPLWHGSLFDGQLPG